MKTKQPQWRLVANLGDVNPIEYGGFFVYIDRTGTYPPEAELLIPPDGADDAPSEHAWTIYRFILEPMTLVDDVLSENPYHPDHPVWFGDKLADIAATHGATVDSLIEGFLSPNPVLRALAWRMVGEHFGFDNLDAYPRHYSKRSELPRRIRRPGKKGD